MPWHPLFGKKPIYRIYTKLQILILWLGRWTRTCIEMWRWWRFNWCLGFWVFWLLSTLDRLQFHSNPCRIFSRQNILTLEFIASKWELLHKHNLWTESRLEAIRGTCNTFLSWKLWYLVVREALPIWTFLLHHSYVNFLLDLDFLLNSNTFVPVNDSHSGLMRHTLP